MSLVIQSDGVLEAVAAKLENLPDWMPQIVARHFEDLGQNVQHVMQGKLEPHRYTGRLSESVAAEYAQGEQELRIYPTATRRGHDAGTLLEEGTGPIPNAPFGPIKAWADFRGLPAFPIWWKIRQVGIDEHPFLARTLQDYATQTAMMNTAHRIVLDMALELASTEGVTEIGLERA